MWNSCVTTTRYVEPSYYSQKISHRNNICYVIFLCMTVPKFVYPFSWWCILWLFPFQGNYEQSFSHILVIVCWWTCILNVCVNFIGMEFLGHKMDIWSDLVDRVKYLSKAVEKNWCSYITVKFKNVIVQ